MFENSVSTGTVWAFPFYILPCGNNAPDSLPILHCVFTGFQKCWVKKDEVLIRSFEKKPYFTASISVFIKELSATRNRDVNRFWESFSVQEAFSWAKSSRKLFNWQYLTEIFHTEPLRGLHIPIHAIYSYTHRRNYCQEQSPKGWWARISWSLQQAPK